MHAAGKRHLLPRPRPGLGVAAEQHDRGDRDKDGGERDEDAGLDALEGPEPGRGRVEAERFVSYW